MATVLIVGAGVTGLLTAVECALAGHRVTVLDRGAVPNPESSSFDQHRAIRTLAFGDPAATGRMVTAHRRWSELEALLDTRFYRRVGVVTAWPRDQVPAVASFAATAGVPVETVEPEKLPHLRFPEGTVGLLETDGGVLLARRVLRAVARWLAGRPAVTVRPGRAVTGLDVHSGRTRLAGGETLRADLVLIAAGPWTADLIELPAVLHRQTMVYLRPPRNLVRWWESAPAVGGLGDDGRAWLLPPGAGTLLKLSTDAAAREVSSVDCAEPVAPWAGRVLGAGMLSDLDGYDVVAVRHCHYLTGAPAGAAPLARVGPAVWSRTACGGSGFSSAPLVAGDFVAAMEDAA